MVSRNLERANENDGFKMTALEINNTSLFVYIFGTYTLFIHMKLFIQLKLIIVLERWSLAETYGVGLLGFFSFLFFSSFFLNFLFYGLGIP